MVVGVGFLIGLFGVIGFLFMENINLQGMFVGIVGYINLLVLLVISIGLILIVLIGVLMVYSFSEKMFKCLFGIYLVIVLVVMFVKVL